MFVTERFHLEPKFKEYLKSLPVPWGFGLFSEVTYYSRYSRAIYEHRLIGYDEDSGEFKYEDVVVGQEQWPDTVSRVVEGCFSIRKDWYVKHGLYWNDDEMQDAAEELAMAIFEIKFLPPGRGLWAMGTENTYLKGSMSLNNCGFVDVKNDLASAACWAMDALMCGVGVGFSTQNARLHQHRRADQGPRSERTFVVPDDREGWVESLNLLIRSYMGTDEERRVHWNFDYSVVRPAGVPLKGFGGISSGPDPLIKLHERVERFCKQFQAFEVDQTRFIVDVFNAIGGCVVAGNIRRSAEIATGSVDDTTFLDLKNYDKYPEREELGWMSNNSVVLRESHEFEQLPVIAERVQRNGEPGIINLINIQKYGRIGKKKPDAAIGMNPCGEIPLEDRELCNVVEVFPSRCEDKYEIWRMMELATFYASTVSLLPTHDTTTNEVVARNRRIGVSVSGIADWIDATSVSEATMVLREGYEQHVEPVNAALNDEAGIPRSIRLTTVKPSGTISLLAGVSPGMHWPYARYAIRRIRISETSPIADILIKAGIHYEKDDYSDATWCFSFPLASGKGQTRAEDEVSIWEKMALVAMLGREWADNAVSNTVTFLKSESAQVERVIAFFAPLVKSLSLLPNQGESEHAYTQLPFEPITKEVYMEMSRQMEDIDWNALRGIDGSDTQFCDSESCEIPV